ncbi:diguanylate cyclase [Ectopseudomonas alcaliphila]|uniref:diguanylate cyclase n=1 Tax=Ectopseudomonas alcaliphila TaxID=101564 RepID=A0A1G7DR92_9GAMM|nr:diguanylate cyclase [Pseudomonas alcaliphila]MDX5990571.1 diguanylate cyclase [Pseudomonas alcaliphila]SDE53932.1 sigma-B regulation protein RsbU (phosphoserine phosphatase) [Pseudomonas alcaliphila]
MLYLDRLPGPVLVTDCNGRIKHCNCDFKRLAGVGTAEGMDQFFPPASRIFLQTHAWPLLLRNGEFSELYLQLQSEGGQAIPVMTNARISEVDGTPEVIWLFFVAKDRQRFEAELLKAREQAQESAAQLAKANLALQSAYAQLANYAVEIQSEAEQLAQLSHTDPLTALSNRRALSVHVEQWLGSVSDLACGSLLLIDIDHFKQINDRFGHAEGDRVLVDMAQRLLASVRSGDSVVRYGGEEFAIWLPNADLDEASDIAERVHDQIKALEVANESITVSIGIASLKPCAEYLEHLLAAADKALYTAKAQGRNRSIRHE